MTIVNALNVETDEALILDILNIGATGNYKGLWDASTNDPFLTNGVGEDGDYYEVSVAGTVDFGAGEISFNVGDIVKYLAGKWQKGEKPLIDDNNISLDTTWSSSKISQTIEEMSAALAEDIVANVTVGGVTSGQTLTEGTTFTDVMKAIFVKYMAPVITTSSNKTLLNKKGTTISQPIRITATSTKKSKPITKTSIIYLGNEVASGTNPNGETLTYDYTTDISTDTTFYGRVEDGQQTVNSVLKFEFIVPFYYGVSNSNTVSSLTGLTELLEKKGNKSVTLSPNNQYVIYMYDSSYGNLSKIIDPNGFDITPSFNRSEVTIDGQTYKCYVSNDKSTNTNFKYTFNF